MRKNGKLYNGVPTKWIFQQKNKNAIKCSRRRYAPSVPDTRTLQIKLELTHSMDIVVQYAICNQVIWWFYNNTSRCIRWNLISCTIFAKSFCFKWEKIHSHLRWSCAHHEYITFPTLRLHFLRYYLYFPDCIECENKFINSQSRMTMHSMFCWTYFILIATMEICSWRDACRIVNRVC